MIAMNARVKLDRVSDSRVAADFVSQTFAIVSVVREDTLWDRFLPPHARAPDAGLDIAFRRYSDRDSLGNRCSEIRAIRAGHSGSGWGVVQTNSCSCASRRDDSAPGSRESACDRRSLSLQPASNCAQHLYRSARHTASDSGVRPFALGLTHRARLRLVELPMASRSILSGIKTSAVINVGFATLGALIGAGGYGQPILTGIRLDDWGLIMEGAVPAALLALVMQGGFDLADRFFVSPGLRLASEV